MSGDPHQGNLSSSRARALPDDRASEGARRTAPGERRRGLARAVEGQAASVDAWNGVTSALSARRLEPAAAAVAQPDRPGIEARFPERADGPRERRP
jgi:hypothetical protein